MQIAQVRPRNDDQNLDKFSELPLLVFHHILSFLGVNDVARLYFASPRCRELCTSSPYMLFDVNFDEESCTSKCTGFRRFLYKLLDEQDGSEWLQMHRFRLHWNCHDCKDFSPTSLFHRWVNRAVSCNAQEIDIGFFPSQGDSFILPNCLSRASTTIRILRLKLWPSWGCELNCLPMDFTSIQVLSLNSILVDSGCLLGEWISDHFASLKTLNLEVVRLCQNLSITSSSLQCLTISHCIMEAEELSIQCPSLKYLRIESCTITNMGFDVECGELKSLQVHDCHFDFAGFGIFGPSLKDLQISSCSFKHNMVYYISAEALCTFFVDITLGPAGCMLGYFDIEPPSMQIMKRVNLKLSLDFEPHLRLNLLDAFPKFNDIHVLDIDIDTIKILDLEEMGIVFGNIHHLEVTVTNFQDMNSTDIATFVIVMCSASASVATVTLNYNDCQSDQVVRLLKSVVEFVRREIPVAVEINCLGRPITTILPPDAAVRYSRSWSNK